MLKYFLLIFLLILNSYSKAEIKDKIIQNLENTNNLDFNFEQNIKRLNIKAHLFYQHDLLY